MIRAITTQLQQEIADRFALTEVDSVTSGPRDVLWAPAEIALRNRMEQSAQLGRDPEILPPFLSFWRIAERLDKPRLNLPAAEYGVPTGSGLTRRYKLTPVDLVYQIEHWAEKEVNHEDAIRRFFQWSDFPPPLTLTDVNGVTFDLPTTFMDPVDNSRIPEIWNIGSLYRETMVVRIGGYVVEDSGAGAFKTIETITWNVYDYSAYGTTEDAVLVKAMPDITEGS